MERFNIKLADHIIQIETRFEKNRAFFSDYMADMSASPEIYASISDDELNKTVSAVPDASPETAELTALYRPIAEALPNLGGIVFHGAAISFGGKGYIFTASSGTGKSTHIRLWRKYLGRSVGIINGDKPIITATDQGVFVHGTPWSGKERWQKNCSFPLGGICLLYRGESCNAGKAELDRLLPFLFAQTYISQNPDITGKTMELIDKLIKTVPISYLYCDISENAVKYSFEQMTGLIYSDNKTLQ